MLYIHKGSNISIRRHLTLAALWVMILALVTLVACVTIPPASPAPVVVIMAGTPVGTDDQGALAAILTQQQIDVIKNIIAAQVAATAVVVRANARATVVAAASTQNAALTQDAIRQTQTGYSLQVTQAAGTQSAGDILAQQYKNDLAAATQTSVANNIATQTQVAVATSQWYTDQGRQRQDQIRNSFAFLWMWCFPVFIVLLAGLLVWGFWRWLKIRQANQRILDNPADRLPAPGIEAKDHRHDDSMPYIEGEVVDSRYRLTSPVDPVRRWLDEVKGKLRNSDKKDDDDNADE